MSILSRRFRFQGSPVSSLRPRIRSPAEAAVYSGLPEDRGLCVPVCRPDRNDGEILLTRLFSAPHRARVHESTRINTPEGPVPSISLEKPRYPSTALARSTARRTRRDFVALYTSVQRSSLTELLRLFDRKYAQTAYSKIHILKSLIFFEDAEKDPMPHLLTPIDWGEVKRFFLRENSAPSLTGGEEREQD
jgi:hypothetical protein